MDEFQGKECKSLKDLRLVVKNDFFHGPFIKKVYFLVYFLSILYMPGQMKTLGSPKLKV